MPRSAIGLAVILLLLALWSYRSVFGQGPVDPATVDLTLAPGESAEVEKTVAVPEVPAVSDVLIAFDLTGSMGGELSNLQGEAQDIIDDLSAAVSDLHMGLISFEDYPAVYDCTADEAGCDYVSEYGDAAFGDEPFRVDQSITNDFNALKTAVNNMVIKYGSDAPEAYARALWETAQSDSGIGFRASAAKLVVMFLDNIPHDCDLNQGITSPPFDPFVTGIDPGRNAVIDFDGDDIDWQDDALADASAAGVKLLVIESTNPPCAFETYYTAWTALTGGSYVCINSNGSVPGGQSLSDTILGLIGEAFATVDVTMVPVDCDPLVLTFDPASHDAVETPATVTFTETVTVPSGTASGTYSCTVEARMDGNVLGEQTVTVMVPGATPTATATATATPAAAAPAGLPETGGTPSDGGSSALPWLAAVVAIAAVSAGGVWFAYQRRRVR